MVCDHCSDSSLLFASLSLNSIFMNVGSWCKNARQGGITFLGMHVFVLCCPGGAVRAGHLIVSWFMTETEIYVGFVGWCDIHCKFLSTFGGANWSVCIIFIALYGPIRHTTVWSYCICIIFVILFVFIFMYKFYLLVESVYWFQSIPLPLCLFDLSGSILHFM